MSKSSISRGESLRALLAINTSVSVSSRPSHDTLHHHPDMDLGETASQMSGGSSEYGSGKVRLVGRGGRGSKPRSGSISGVSSPSSSTSAVSPRVQPSPNPSSLSTTYRVGGRGGAGSRPRPIKTPKSAASSEASTSQSQLISPPLSPVSEGKPIRMGGRGGAGSKPRQIRTDSGKTLGDIKLKLKGKAKSTEPLYPSNRQFYLSNSSNADGLSMASSIHFAPTPAVKNGQQRAAVYEPFGQDRNTGSSTPSLSSTAIEHDLPPTPTSASFSDVDHEHAQFESSSRRANKLAKTLGVSGVGTPSPFTFNHLSKKKPAVITKPESRTDWGNPALAQAPSSTPLKRRPRPSSVSVSSENFLNSSHASLPMGSEDGERFSVLIDDSGPASASVPPASPMMFAPPSTPPPNELTKGLTKPPVTRSTSMSSVDSSAVKSYAASISTQDTAETEDTLDLELPEDVKHRFPPSPPPKMVIVEEDNAPTPTSDLPSYNQTMFGRTNPDRPDSPFVNSTIPVSRNLLVVAGGNRSDEGYDSDEDERFNASRLVVRRDEGWKGEWNQRTLGDVINKLRALK